MIVISSNLRYFCYGKALNDETVFFWGDVEAYRQFSAMLYPIIGRTSNESPALLVFHAITFFKQLTKNEGFPGFERWVLS